MTLRVGLAVFALSLAGGCVSTPTPPVERPDSAGPEYEVGLSHALELAAGESQVEMFTHTYRLGFTSGQSEAMGVVMNRAGQMREMGCAGLLVPILQAVGSTPVTVEWCATLKDSKVADARIEGPIFAKGRLTVVRFGLKTSDVSLREALLTAYEIGYRESAMAIGERDMTDSSAADSALYGCLQAKNRAVEITGDQSLTVSLAPTCQAVADDVRVSLPKFKAEFARARAEVQ